jgi:hypothetical protein
MKTIFKFFLSFFLVSAYSSSAQNRVTDTSATCIAFWNNKETKVYQIKHRKEKYEMSKVKAASEANYEVYLKVLDSAETGYTIEWGYKNFTAAGAKEHTLSSLNSIMEGLKIIYKTDDVGMFTELVNWKEVRDFAFSNYEKAISKPSQDKEFVAALNQVKAILQSKENTEAILIKEVQLYHSPYGVEYAITGKEVETELPNVTGGRPFPAKIIIKLEELNSKKDYCRVSLNQVVDKGKAGPIIAEMLKKLSGSEIKNEDELKEQVQGMEISDVNEFTYSVSGGWLSRIFYKRTSNVGNFKQIETYEITEKTGF